MENCNHIFNNEQFSYTAISAKDFWVIDDDTFVFENGKGG